MPTGEGGGLSSLPEDALPHQSRQPAEPGLVLALVSGGSCRGLAYRVPRAQGAALLAQLWLREMPNGVYEPRWLTCSTPAGQVRALAFTLPRSSPTGRAS